jgi:uncharacterized delta-60 repeat protein/uncharacterized repeat protein (TIGR01451 family)
MSITYPLGRGFEQSKLRRGLQCLAPVVSAVLFIAFTLHAFQNAVAAPGDLDPTFGENGLVTTPQLIPQALILQPDGRIIVGGQTAETGQLAVARYTSTGAVDDTFGNNGLVSLEYHYELAALALQTDGKILAAGRDFLLRLTTAGDVDTSFGNAGIITAPLGAACGAANSSCALAAVTVDEQDHIVAGGSSGYTSGRFLISDLAIARYTSSGVLDTSFNGTGVALSDFLAEDRAASVLLQPDGKIVIAGTASPEPAFGLRFALARVNSDGSRDDSFGTHGQVVTTPGGVWAALGDAVLQPDGKIVVAGSSWWNNHFDSTLARYSPAGDLDPTFGQAGLVTNTTMGFVVGIAIQQDGRLIVLDGDFNLARYWPDGQLDTTFGLNGQLGKPRDDAQSASALTLQPDGKFIATGTQLSNTLHAAAYGTLIARYQNKLLNFHQTVTTLAPEAGQLITYTFTLENADSLTTTQVAISDFLPAELTWAGPLIIDPPLSSTIGLPPYLVSHLTLAPWQVVTLTLPVTVNLGLTDGTVITHQLTVMTVQTADVLTSSLVITTPGAPVAAPDYALTPMNTSVSIDVLVNDWDPNNDQIALIAVSVPLSGAAIVDDGHITYTPALDFSGNDTFTYTISDERFTASGLISVSIPQIVRRLYLPLFYND